ncbi:uncharacterized protein LOC101857584 [Aplysia californica]|uniref:Uncharacterized protein LOC101857584 n=1 Tax=Aplysia californica TaxID=6500 RepID=A0ABM0JYN7_APLCA|nr:uncharacterized protein LOC101857584 [Aplysia californica]
MAERLRIKFLGTSVDPCSQVTPHDNVSLLTSTKADSKVMEQGKQLFDHFIADRMSKGQDDSSIRSVSLPPELGQTAARLCELASTFAQSPERLMVKEAAKAVRDDFSLSELADLLFSMMSDSKNLEEDIIVMFYFCLDLTERACVSNSNNFRHLVSYCKELVTSAVGPRVQDHGGWREVVQLTTSLLLSPQTTSLLVLAKAGLVVARALTSSAPRDPEDLGTEV